MLHSLIDFYEPGDVKTGIHQHCQVGCLIPKKHNNVEEDRKYSWKFKQL